MTFVFEESCRARIEQEFGSIIEFKRELYRMLPAVKELVVSVVECLKVALEQYMIGILEFIRSWWNAIREDLIETFKSLRDSVSEIPTIHTRLRHKCIYKYSYRPKCSMAYDKNRTNTPMYCRCRSRC